MLNREDNQDVKSPVFGAQGNWVNPKSDTCQLCGCRHTYLLKTISSTQEEWKTFKMRKQY